jgi:hypothetical protein
MHTIHGNRGDGVNAGHYSTTVQRMNAAQYTGGYTSPEEVRDCFKGDSAGIDLILARVRDGHCPCCGNKWDMIELECGHKMCINFCLNRNHECIPCALSV